MECHSNPFKDVFVHGFSGAAVRHSLTLLHCRLGAEVCCVLRLSGPLKQQYAQVRAPPPHVLSLLPWRPTDSAPTGKRSGLGGAAGPWALQGAAPGRHDPMGGEPAAPGPRVLLPPGHQRGNSTAVGGCGLFISLQALE